MGHSSQKLEESQASSRTEHESVRKRFDEDCTKVAVNYELFYSNGKPRKAQIIETLSKTTCTSCIDKMLRKKSTNAVDSFYTECHSLACNILVEELHARLTEKGYSVLIATENELGGYGKIDVLLIPNHHGVDLHFNKKEVGIEVKTGERLAFSQIFRYLLDNKDRTVIVWRIKKRQLLFFEGAKLEPLLTQFMKMIISRAERLLSNPESNCEHVSEFKNWTPSQEKLQAAFVGFAGGVVETLSTVVKIVVTMLDEEEANNVEDCKLCP